MLALFRQIRGPARACAHAFGLVLLGLGTAAGSPAAAPAAAAAVPAAGIAQVVFGLAVVLALVGGAAWLLKRSSGNRSTVPGLIRIMSAASIGPRERIVLVEVAGTWLVVGVAPGQVRALHAMPRSEADAVSDAPAPAPANASFAAWLRRVTERRKHV